MTCEEFERVLPELGESQSIEQESHLKSCSTCSELLADLNAIAQQAHAFQSQDEPSPRVWNSIEIMLRQEGLIHQTDREPSLSPSRARLSGRLRWLVPLTAAFVLAFGVFLHQQKEILPQVAHTQPATSTLALSQPDTSVFGPEDQKLLQTVTERTPSMRAAYEADLRKVNSYVRDAELMTKSAPNDEVAQQYLMNAYEQRAMVYEMALDRSTVK
jgi:hypothetical protein